MYVCCMHIQICAFMSFYVITTLLLMFYQKVGAENALKCAHRCVYIGILQSLGLAKNRPQALLESELKIFDQNFVKTRILGVFQS